MMHVYVFALTKSLAVLVLGNIACALLALARKTPSERTNAATLYCGVAIAAELVLRVVSATKPPSRQL